MNQTWSKLKKQRRRVSKLAEVAAHAHLEADSVENNPWSMPDDVAEAKAAKRRAFIAHTWEHQRLLRNIGEFLYERGIVPTRRIVSRVFDMLRPRPDRGGYA